MKNKKIAIAITGGAVSVPLLNNVISTFVENCNVNQEVVGLRGGFAPLEYDNFSGVCDLRKLVSRNSNDSFLVTERSLPERSNEAWNKIIENLTNELGVSSLLVIGGDGTFYTANKIWQHSKGKLNHLVQILKTMDGDVLKPEWCLGFQSAAYHSSEFLKGVITEATLYGQPYLARILGRNCSNVAIAAGKNADAQLVIIPEEFESTTNSNSIVNIIIGAQLKCLYQTGNFGVTIFPEGLASIINDNEALGVKITSSKNHSLIDYSASPFEIVLSELLQKKMNDLGISLFSSNLKVASRTIGYAARCQNPVADDIALSVRMGAKAAKYCMENGKSNGAYVLTPESEIPFSEILSPDGEHVRSTTVNLSSDPTYFSDQCFLCEKDLEGENGINLAKLTNLSLKKLKAEIGQDCFAYAKSKLKLAKN